MVKFIASDKGYDECYNLHGNMRKKYGSVDNIFKTLKEKLQFD
jgi:hypothetical protein